MIDDDWRARKKAATKHAIQEHALRLFVEKGYDATTVDEIAAAAGVSHMTFFRYFPRKEDVVEYDEYDPLIEELIAERPQAEPPIAALHAAVRIGLDQVLESDRAALLVRTRLILNNPVLRTRNLIAQDATRDLFARALARRASRSTHAQGRPGARQPPSRWIRHSRRDRCAATSVPGHRCGRASPRC